MRRFLSIAVFGVALCTAQAADAQPTRGPRSGGPEAKRLEAELDKLRTETKELEDRLARVKELEAKLARAKESDRRPGPSEGKSDRDGGKDSARRSGSSEGRSDRDGERGAGGGSRGPGPDGRGPKFGPPGDRGGPPHRPEGRDGFARGGRPGSWGSEADLVRRIDRMIHELEQIKAEVQHHSGTGAGRRSEEAPPPRPKFDGPGRRGDDSIPPPRKKFDGPGR